MSFLAQAPLGAARNKILNFRLMFFELWTFQLRIDDCGLRIENTPGAGFQFPIRNPLSALRGLSASKGRLSLEMACFVNSRCAVSPSGNPPQMPRRCSKTSAD